MEGVGVFGGLIFLFTKFVEVVVSDGLGFGGLSFVDGVFAGDGLERGVGGVD